VPADKSSGLDNGDINDGRNDSEFEVLFGGDSLEGWRKYTNLPIDKIGGKWEVSSNAIVGDKEPPGNGGGTGYEE
jgi:hypothetical protein